MHIQVDTDLLSLLAQIQRFNFGQNAKNQKSIATVIIEGQMVRETALPCTLSLLPHIQ